MNRRPTIELQAIRSTLAPHGVMYYNVSDMLLEEMDGCIYAGLGWDEMLGCVYRMMSWLPNPYTLSSPRVLPGYYQEAWTTKVTPIESDLWCVEREGKFNSFLTCDETFGFIAAMTAPQKMLFGGLKTYEQAIRQVAFDPATASKFVPYALLEDQR